MQTEIEKQILHEAKGLPENALDEVLHFIQFIRSKWQQEKVTETTNNLTTELHELDSSEWHHLESEVKDYKKLFPHVK